LPKFKIPLAPEDRNRDTIAVDLQMIFTRCHDNGEYATHIDYSKNPPVPLSDNNRRWLEMFLKAEKLRA
jgi:hypothetical protein